MRILLSNDDGVQSPALQLLYDALADMATLSVVAPDRDHSGASNALTLSRPLLAQRQANGFISLDGTPTDCVHLALHQLFSEPFERVISGINTHANLGDDVLYSGTVAAAIEGRWLPLPAMAVSLVNTGGEYFATAARVVRDLLGKTTPLPVGPRTILNINVPDCPYDQLQGMRVTRLGHRSRSSEPLKVTCPRGRDRYWIGMAGAGEDDGEGTDFHAVRAGFVSITPIHVDMTRYDAMADLSAWLKADGSP